MVTQSGFLLINALLDLTFSYAKKGMSALSLKILLGMFALRLSVIVGMDAERENDPSECKPKKLCEVAT